MKKILSLMSLMVVLVLTGVALGGCVIGKKASQPAATSPEANIEIDQTVEIISDEQAGDQPVIDELAGQTEITDDSLEAEIDSLDLEFDDLKTTGFEANSLSDTDLGL